MPRTFTGVLFDVDGVLIDSFGVHRRVWGEWGNSHRLDLPALFAGIAGERGIDTVRRVAPHLDPSVELPAVNELWLRHEADVEAFSGVAELLGEMPANRWGLVTSGPRENVVNLFERLGLPLSPVAVCGEDVEFGKPHPEPYLLGARRLGRSPAECIVLEDAPAGIASARAAGCHVLAIASYATPDHLGEADEICADFICAALRVRALVGE